ncbi:amino acid permease [Leptospira perolatii]|uniref:Amino acid permease n=1 Tax=Leptospira perolatii TaxID=2023191 RepID=A0A2M9ZIR6_9LEPT|nr:amino acid permease [Leptospira perolatii]PJZ68608.1 amino acid permease [Leptospira perolatii]PJZ71955.1 amino acid permease [Leptospira perolatii]
MKLHRSLNLYDSISLMFSSMVGPGVFITTGYILSQTPNPNIVLFCWILGGLLAVAGAMSYAKSASIFPYAGGDYVYLKEAYSPLVAFASGWLSLSVNFSASISLSAIAFSKTFFSLIDPSLDYYFLEWKFLGINFSVGTAQLLGMGAILSFTIVNYFGISIASRIQNFFTTIKILGLVAFVVLGLTIGNYSLDHFQSFSVLPSDTSAWKYVLAGVIPVTFSYLGWNMITYVAEEVRDPEKNIYKAVFVSCTLVTLLYVLINFLYLSSAPSSMLAGDAQIGVTAAGFLFGKKATLFVTAFICWVFMGGISAYIIGGSRIYFAMARDGYFFKSMSKLHSKHKSPYMSLAFQCAYACLFSLVKDIESLLYLITCSTLLLATITAYTPILFEKRHLRTKFRIPGYPYSTFIYIISNIVIIAALLWSKPAEALWGFGFTLLAVPLYYYFKRTKRASTHEAPKMEPYISSLERVPTSLLPENEPVPVASADIL